MLGWVVGVCMIVAGALTMRGAKAIRFAESLARARDCKYVTVSMPGATVPGLNAIRLLTAGQVRALCIVKRAASSVLVGDGVLTSRRRWRLRQFPDGGRLWGWRCLPSKQLAVLLQYRRPRCSSQ